MKKLILFLIILLVMLVSGCKENTIPEENGITAEMQRQIPKIERAIQDAEQESGITLADEQIYIPPIVKDIEEELDVTIERSEEDELLSIDFCGGEFLYTDKYELTSMGIGKFDNNVMYGGEYTIDGWLVSTDPQIFNDGERDYYITIFDWEGEANAKGFILRYIIEDKTIFNVSGKIKDFGSDTLTEQIANDMYEDFKVVSLSDIKS